MATLDVDSLWKDAFPNAPRPVLYSSVERDEDGFRPLTDPQNFIIDIADLSHDQLYALGSNAQTTLQKAQEEYLEISNQIAQINGREPYKKDPQALLDSDEFEERKEAQLYSYKYEKPQAVLIHNGIPGNRLADDLSEQEKHDVRFNQDPFSQGGFVPTERQYKGMLSRSKNHLNPDNWVPVEKDGKKLIPVQQLHKDEFTATYTRRNVDENGELIRPDSEDSDNSLATPSKLVDKRLTRTRFAGRKVPSTREASEAPSTASTPGRKRLATPAFDTKQSTPPIKRRKPNDNGDPNRPKHPNQYTKARERRLLDEAAAARAAGLPVPTPPTAQTYTSSSTTPAGTQIDWSSMTTEQLRSRKGWTDAELTAAVTHDHAWLHDDPAKALEWRDKILNGVNPVRTWSMVKKWAEWKGKGEDKRPRRRVEGKDGTPVSVGGSVEPVGVGGGVVGGVVEGYADGAGGDEGANGHDGDEENGAVAEAELDAAPRRSGRLQK